MAEQTMIQVRVDSELKEQAASVFDRIGIDIPTAVRMFFKAAVREQRLPFSTDVSSSDTREPSDAEKLMDFIQKESRSASKELAMERGPFPSYETSVYKEQNLGPYRHATTTTIAPTGTLSIIAGCSSGVEPLFALCFVRQVMDGEKLTEANSYFVKALHDTGCYSEKLMAEVIEKGTVQPMDYLPEEFNQLH